MGDFRVICAIILKAEEEIVEQMDVMQRIVALKNEQRRLGTSTQSERNAMLLAIAQALGEQSQMLFAANAKDLEQAVAQGLDLPVRKRLVFDDEKLASVIEGIHQVVSLGDPIGKVRGRRMLDEGLLLEQISVPIGVIGMVFESRPDALVQILTLCLKSGNGIVLKGGHEALETNRALVEVIRGALKGFSLGSGWIVHLESRDDVQTMLGMDGYIDLLIPRGTSVFVRYVMEHTRIPVLGHADGKCAMYIDAEADLDLAVRVATDAKCQYPAVCNAVETLLVERSIAASFLPLLKKSLDQWQVVIHGDPTVASIIDCVAAVESDWDTEYLAYELAIKTVDSLQEAMDHIAMHGSGHTDCIITANEEKARIFMRGVDSADVFWNCSTRFSDGFRYGLGAEVGVSTQKIHARGPVGLEGLMSSKWLLAGHGQIVADYAGNHPRPFSFTELPLDGASLIDRGDHR
jgi:glutamate-5-semialdehyde dehydrogenase